MKRQSFARSRRRGSLSLHRIIPSSHHHSSAIPPRLINAIVFISFMLFPICFCTAETSVSMKVEAGFAGFFRPGRFMPVAVTLQAGSESIDGRLIVASDTLVVSQAVKLSPPAARELNVLLVPQALHPRIEVQLISRGKPAALARPEHLRALPPDAALAALAGGTPAGFSALLGKLPPDSQLAPVAPAMLPDDFRGYESLDLLVVGDLTSEPTARQRQAMADWLARGGRMLVIQPVPGGSGRAGDISSFWRRFLPRGKPWPPSPISKPGEGVGVRGNGGQRGPELARSLRAAGLDVFTDKEHEGLVGFAVGLGRVLLADYARESAAATAEGRDALAAAIVSLLDLTKAPPPQAAPSLLAPDIYELFDAASWPSATKRLLTFSVVGYAIVMILALRVLRSERMGIVIGVLAGVSVLLTAVVAAAVLPRSTVVLNTLTLARTRAGASALAVTRYMAFASPVEADCRSRTDFTVGTDAPAKPLFYSDTMLARGPVHVAVQAGQPGNGEMLSFELAAGRGTPSVLEQPAVGRIEGAISADESGFRAWTITNRAASLATGQQIVFSDIILTDGTDTLPLAELPPGKPVLADFESSNCVPAERLVWDRFAQRAPLKYRVLRRWLRDHPPESGIFLLCWSEPQFRPNVHARFLEVNCADTLWEIRLR